MSESTTVKKRGRVRFAPWAVAVGVASTALLGLSTTGTLSAFVASITNSTNTAASGTVVMTETNSGGTVTCTSGISATAATCANINKFGGSTTMVPGTPVATAINITNTGTAQVNTFTLTPGATCTQSNNGAVNGTATDLCAKLNLTITSGATSVYSGTLASFAGHAAFPLANPTTGTAVPFTFTVTLDPSAGNTYEGLAASVPMTWAFSSPL